MVGLRRGARAAPPAEKAVLVDLHQRVAEAAKACMARLERTACIRSTYPQVYKRLQEYTATVHTGLTQLAATWSPADSAYSKEAADFKTKAVIALSVEDLLDHRMDGIASSLRAWPVPKDIGDAALDGMFTTEYMPAAWPPAAPEMFDAIGDCDAEQCMKLIDRGDLDIDAVNLVHYPEDEAPKKGDSLLAAAWRMFGADNSVCAALINLGACVDIEVSRCGEPTKQRVLDELRRKNEATWHMYEQRLELVDSIACGDVARCRAVLDKNGTDPNMWDGAGRTPLMHAVACGMEPVVVSLVKAGAHLDFKDRAGVMPIEIASCPMRETMVACATEVQRLFSLLLTGSVEDCINVIGGNPNIDLRIKTVDYYTPLLTAARMQREPEVFAVLIEAGADVNSVKTYHNAEYGVYLEDNSLEDPVTGDTPLLVASQCKDMENICFQLIEAGADVHAKNSFNRTVLLNAALAGSERLCLKLIEMGVDVREADAGLSQLDPLACAMGAKLEKVALTLIDHPDDPVGYNPYGRVKCAVQNKMEKVALRLLEKGAVVEDGTVEPYYDDPDGAWENAEAFDPEELEEEMEDDPMEGITTLIAASYAGFRALTEALMESHPEKVHDEVNCGAYWATPLGGMINTGMTNLAVDLVQVCQVKVNYFTCLEHEDETHHFSSRQATPVGADTRGVRMERLDATILTPLMLAARLGQGDVCLALIDADADIHITSDHSVSSLHYAAESGLTDVCVKLLEKGAEVDPVERLTAYQRTPLFSALTTKNEELAMLLIKRGANVHTLDLKCDSPLTHAVHEHLEVSLECVRRGACADLSAPFTPFMVATMFACSQCTSEGTITPETRKKYEQLSLEMIRRGSNPMTLVCGSPFRTAYDCAVINDRTGLNERLKDEFLLTQKLLDSAKFGVIEKCKEVLDQGADPDSRDCHGETVLMVAKGYNHGEICVELARRGADVAATDRSGSDHNMKAYIEEVLNGMREKEQANPLLAAVRDGDFEKSLVLMRQGEDVNCCTYAGDTLLTVAARAGRVDICTELIRHGADLEAKNFNNSTALHYLDATVASELIALEKRVDQEHRSTLPLFTAAAEGDLHKCVNLVDMGGNANARDRIGNTLLTVAARKGGNMDLCVALVRKGADVKQLNADGTTALDAVSEKVAQQLLHEHQVKAAAKQDQKRVKEERKQRQQLQSEEDKERTGVAQEEHKARAQVFQPCLTFLAKLMKAYKRWQALEPEEQQNRASLLAAEQKVAHRLVMDMETGARRVLTSEQQAAWQGVQRMLKAHAKALQVLQKLVGTEGTQRTTLAREEKQAFERIQWGAEKHRSDVEEGMVAAAKAQRVASAAVVAVDTAAPTIDVDADAAAGGGSEVDPGSSAASSPVNRAPSSYRGHAAEAGDRNEERDALLNAPEPPAPAADADARVASPPTVPATLSIGGVAMRPLVAKDGTSKATAASRALATREAKDKENREKNGGGGASAPVAAGGGRVRAVGGGSGDPPPHSPRAGASGAPGEATPTGSGGSSRSSAAAPRGSGTGDATATSASRAGDDTQTPMEGDDARAAASAAVAGPRLQGAWVKRAETAAQPEKEPPADTAGGMSSTTSVGDADDEALRQSTKDILSNLPELAAGAEAVDVDGTHTTTTAAAAAAPNPGVGVEAAGPDPTARGMPWFCPLPDVLRTRALGDLTDEEAFMMYNEEVQRWGNFQKEFHARHGTNSAREDLDHPSLASVRALYERCEALALRLGIPPPLGKAQHSLLPPTASPASSGLPDDMPFIDFGDALSLDTALNVNLNLNLPPAPAPPAVTTAPPTAFSVAAAVLDPFWGAPQPPAAGSTPAAAPLAGLALDKRGGREDGFGAGLGVGSVLGGLLNTDPLAALEPTNGHGGLGNGSSGGGGATTDLLGSVITSMCGVVESNHTTVTARLEAMEQTQSEQTKVLCLLQAQMAQMDRMAARIAQLEAAAGLAGPGRGRCAWCGVDPGAFPYCGMTGRIHVSGHDARTRVEDTQRAHAVPGSVLTRHPALAQAVLILAFADVMGVPADVADAAAGWLKAQVPAAKDPAYTCSGLPATVAPYAPDATGAAAAVAP